MQDKWLTISELSEHTGKSTASIRMWIKRRTAKGDQVRVKKERGKHCESWLIHSSEVKTWGELVHAENSGEQIPELVNIISLDRYEAMRRTLENEREQAMQGLMMYRYKFEELERQMKLLPAPPEIMASKLTDLEEVLGTEVQYREQLTSALQERDAKVRELEADLQKARRPWWKRLFGLK